MAETIQMPPPRQRRPPAKARQVDAKPQTARPMPKFADRGRAWINGSEVGGTDPRYAHLNRSYD